MKLYDYCRSSAAYRVRIALNLKELDYQHFSVNLLQGMQKQADYKQTNPQGLVPALEIDQQVITQSLAICEYLDDAYPDTFQLLPKAPLEKAQVRAMALSIACDIHPLNNLRVLNYLVNDLSASEEQKLDWYKHWIQEGFTAIEAQLQDSDTFCVGNEPSLVDICLVPQVFNANRFKVPMDAFPNINKVVENCNALDAFKAAHPNEQPDS